MAVTLWAGGNEKTPRGAGTAQWTQPGWSMAVTLWTGWEEVGGWEGAERHSHCSVAQAHVFEKNVSACDFASTIYVKAKTNTL